MLLVTFHGGSGGINNVYVFSTKNDSLETSEALAAPGVTLSELRSMVIHDGKLYVANGAKSTSNVLCFEGPDSGPSFPYLSTFVAATFSKDKHHFKTSIAHPFSLAFDGDSHCYVSNQDTNVVAVMDVSADGQTGTLGKGSQSNYLTKLYGTEATFLDGTFVASQNGNLHDVEISATDVSAINGGLKVKTDKSRKTENSVRGVAVAATIGILFVCDEADFRVNLYNLNDGTFIGSSQIGSKSDKPTHLVIHNGGIWLSAGEKLCWSQLPSSTSDVSLAFQYIAITPPKDNKIGGIAIDASTSTAYVSFQDGTGETGTGSICKYYLEQDSPSTLPVLSGKRVFAQDLKDTPEFVLFMAD